MNHLAAMDHTKCGVSTGICGSLTYGQGKLSENGYWEKPCWLCAREAEIDDGVPANSYWPVTLKDPFRIPNPKG